LPCTAQHWSAAMLYCCLPSGAAHRWSEGISCSSSQEGSEAATSKQEGFWRQLTTFVLHVVGCHRGGPNYTTSAGLSADQSITFMHTCVQSVQRDLPAECAMQLHIYRLCLRSVALEMCCAITPVEQRQAAWQYVESDVQVIADVDRR
jgi:hypothetical protein